MSTPAALFSEPRSRTFFFPLVSLIVALLLLGQQRSTRKRAQLRTWAWASADWIALQAVVVIMLFAAIGSSGTSVDRGGPCVGGPEPDADGKAIGNDRFVIPCAGGGTVTMRFP